MIFFWSEEHVRAYRMNAQQPDGMYLARVQDAFMRLMCAGRAVDRLISKFLEKRDMRYSAIVEIIADILKEYDMEKPVHKDFKPGIGPFGEPQIVKVIASRLIRYGIPAQTKRTPDLVIHGEWAIEFKIVRPFGDNGKQAEDWSVNMLHPYPGNVSLLGDAIKLIKLDEFPQRGLFIIGFEHDPARISLDPLIKSFEQIAIQVMDIPLGERIEERRSGLVHPEHQILRCIGWQLRI